MVFVRGFGFCWVIGGVCLFYFTPLGFWRVDGRCVCYNYVTPLGLFLVVNGNVGFLQGNILMVNF